MFCDKNAPEPHSTDNRSVQETQDDRRRIPETSNKTRNKETVNRMQMKTQKSVSKQRQTKEEQTRH